MNMSGNTNADLALSYWGLPIFIWFVIILFYCHLCVAPTRALWIEKVLAKVNALAFWLNYKNDLRFDRNKVVSHGKEINVSPEENIRKNYKRLVSFFFFFLCFTFSIVKRHRQMCSQRYLMDWTYIEHELIVVAIGWSRVRACGPISKSVKLGPFPAYSIIWMVCAILMSLGLIKALMLFNGAGLLPVKCSSSERAQHSLWCVHT